jgi:hypothetical protein
MSSMRCVLFLTVAALAVACGGEPAPAPAPVPPPPAPPPAPEAVSGAETAALADTIRAIGTELECADFTVAVGQALVSHRGAMDRRRAGAEADLTPLAEDDEAVLQALAAKARDCTGQVDLVDLGVEYLPQGLRPGEAATCECGTWCPTGFDAWMEVAVAAAGCAGGDETACCAAESWASYDACVETGCNNCCCCVALPLDEGEEEGEEE